MHRHNQYQDSNVLTAQHWSVRWLDQVDALSPKVSHIVKRALNLHFVTRYGKREIGVLARVNNERIVIVIAVSILE